MHRVFPFTFIFGMFLMAGLMSACQLFLRRSTTWLYGIWFCLYYEMVLLWQMPIAWFTFWKSTWGTRMTPADVAEAAKKAGKPVPSPTAAAKEAISAPPPNVAAFVPKPEDHPAKKKMPPVQQKAETDDDLRVQIAALQERIRHQQNELDQLERRVKEADDHAGR